MPGNPFNYCLSSHSIFFRFEYFFQKYRPKDTFRLLPHKLLKEFPVTSWFIWIQLGYFSGLQSGIGDGVVSTEKNPCTWLTAVVFAPGRKWLYVSSVIWTVA